MYIFINVIGLFFLIFLPSSTFALDGNKLHAYFQSNNEWAKSNARSYIQGLNDGISELILLTVKYRLNNSNEDTKKINLIFETQKSLGFCAPIGLTVKKQVEIIKNFLDFNEFKRNNQGIDIYLEALSERYPCNEKYKYQLYSRFNKSQKVEDCYKVSNKIKFCGRDLGWTLSNNPNPDALAMFRLNSKTYSMFLYEEVGKSSGLRYQILKDAIQVATPAGLGLTKNSITFFEDKYFFLENYKYKTFRYKIDYRGMEMYYYNTIVLQNDITLQLITMSVGNPGVEGDINHVNFLSKIELDI